MVRAVRLAADPRVHDRARDARRDRGEGGARGAPLRRADRGRARPAPRRDSAVRRARGSSPRPGSSAHISPELAAQPGIAQNKIPGEDLWDHTLRTVDAAPADPPMVRLAALVHDIGKPATAADGHFYGHEAVGAELRRAFLDRLHEPRGRRRTGRPPRPTPHVRLRGDLDAMRPSGASSARSGRTRSTSCSRCARPTTSGAACRDGRRARRAAGPDRGGARGRRRPRPARPGDRRRRPDDRARARARAEPRLASSTRCSNG